MLYTSENRVLLPGLRSYPQHAVSHHRAFSEVFLLLSRSPRGLCAAGMVSGIGLGGEGRRPPGILSFSQIKRLVDPFDRPDPRKLRGKERGAVFYRGGDDTLVQR